MSTLADLERVVSHLRAQVARLEDMNEKPTPRSLTRHANTIAAYIAAQRERDALIRDLTTIVRMPNVEYEADRHNRAVELLRLNALPKVAEAMSKQPYQATPHADLISQIMDSRVPKNEREWAAGREIERLRTDLAVMNDAIDAAYEDGRISACNAGKPGCPRVKELEAKLAASEAACAPFLKDGETPAECIQRWRADAAGVLELLRQEKLRSEKVEAACAQMREALQGLEDWLADCDDPELVDDYDRACGAAAAALATDAGRGWVSTEGAVEAVPSYVFNTDYASVDGVRLPAAWASGPVLIIPKPEDKP